jgi:hypothetical protein
MSFDTAVPETIMGKLPGHADESSEKPMIVSAGV